MKRFIFLRIIFLSLIGIVLYALFSNQDQLSYISNEVEQEEPIEITFSSSWSGIDSKTEILEGIIDDFENEHPNIKIINNSIFGEDFLFTLKADFASGNGPDVFGLWPGSDLDLLIQEGFIADLSHVLDNSPEWYSSFDKNVFEVMVTDQGIYSIPFEIIYEGLFLNLDLFEEYNINPPEDYDDLIDVIKSFKANGVTPIAYNLTPEGSFIYQNIIVALSGKYATENPYMDSGNIRSGYIEAMYLMRELYEIGAFPKNAFTLDDVSRNQLFIDKKAAMIVQGSWFSSEALGTDIGLIPFPTNDYRKSIIYGIGNGNFHVSSQAYDDPEKQEAVITFLKYLTSKESRNKFSELPGFITSDNTATDDHLKKIGYQLIEDADELVGPPDHFINRNKWEAILIKEFPNMLEGIISPEEIFELLEED